MYLQDSIKVPIHKSDPKDPSIIESYPYLTLCARYFSNFIYERLQGGHRNPKLKFPDFSLTKK